jgi:hypothetical protein
VRAGPNLGAQAQVHWADREDSNVSKECAGYDLADSSANAAESEIITRSREILGNLDRGGVMR